LGNDGINTLIGFGGDGQGGSSVKHSSIAEGGREPVWISGRGG
jgi:hypothetical protein